MQRKQDIMKYSIIILCAGLMAGCASLKPDDTPDPSNPTPPPPTVAWRKDMATIKAVNNAVEFKTRNVQLPTRPNADGGSEYIIARIMGDGYARILLMTMDTDKGRRNGARIFAEGPGGGEFNGRHPVPLPGPTSWRVWSDGTKVRISMDGKEIFSAAGKSVREVVMNGYHKRGFLGEWR
jgi:hypothetical protein